MKRSEEDQNVIRKLLRISLISAGFMVVYIFGGYLANSIAIVADAFHLLSDVLGYVISLGAVVMSHKETVNYLTFGYYKMQPLGALLNIAIIWIVTILLLYYATVRIVKKELVEEPLYMLLTSFVGLACNLYIMRVLHSDYHGAGHHNCSHGHSHPYQHGKKIPTFESPKHQLLPCDSGPSPTYVSKIYSYKANHIHGPGCTHHKDKSTQPQVQFDEIIMTPSTPHYHTSTCSHEHSNSRTLMTSPHHSKYYSEVRPHQFYNINIYAAYIHILTDIILSIGVILSACIICFFAPAGWSYWQLADPLCTYLFSIMAIYSTVPVAKESILLLLDACGDPALVNEVNEYLREDYLIKKYSNLKIWSTNRGKHYAAVRIYTDLPPSIADRQRIEQIFLSKKIKSYIDIRQSEISLEETADEIE